MADTQQLDANVEQPQGTPDGGGSTDGEGQPESWFLEVDDRTRYRTADDAKRAYQEAGKRIATLSNWEKAAKQYGIDNPATLPAIFNDYLSMRQQLAQRQAAPQAQQLPQNAEEQKAQQEEQKAREWLLREAKAAGFVSKEDYETMKQELDSLKGDGQERLQAQFNDRVEQGSTYVEQLMKEANLPTDPRLKLMVETQLRYWIEEDESKGRLQTFMAGGGALRELLKEGFGEVKGAIGLLQNKNSADYVQNKNAAQQRNRNLPDAGTGAARGSATPGAEPPKKGFTPELHNKAWDVFSKFGK